MTDFVLPTSDINFCYVRLDDGSIVILATEAGCDDFLRAMGSQFLGKTVPKLNKFYKNFAKQRGVKRKYSIEFLIENYVVWELFAKKFP